MRFAGRAGYQVVGIFKETGSGVRLGRAERRKVVAVAQARQFNAVLVTELSRWGRSTTDLLTTLKQLEVRRVSVVALNAMTLDLTTPHGRKKAGKKEDLPLPLWERTGGRGQNVLSLRPPPTTDSRHASEVQTVGIRPPIHHL